MGSQAKTVLKTTKDSPTLFSRSTWTKNDAQTCIIDVLTMVFYLPHNAIFAIPGMYFIVGQACSDAAAGISQVRAQMSTEYPATP